jgi:hypothetical protein
MFYENLIALNPLSRDPNLRGEIPLAMEVHDVDPAAMVAGVITADVTSKFGKGKGEIWGAFLLDNIGGDNEIIGVSAAAHSANVGEVTITFHNSDATATTNLGSTKVIFIGKIIPVDPS